MLETLASPGLQFADPIGEYPLRLKFSYCTRASPKLDVKMGRRLFSLSSAAVSVGLSFAQNLISPNDSGVFYAGRTQINEDGSRSFDWEGVQIWINTLKCSYLEIVMNTTGPMTRILTQMRVSGQWFDQSRLWVTTRAGTNTYRIADNLDPSQNYTIRVFHELEPAFSGAQNDPSQYFTFLGFQTDGSALPATPLLRRIEVVGDSISAGYGSQCAGGGPVMDWTSGNYGTYNQLLCDHFQANCSIVAWSGKGMYENCCDNGETMPQYFLQTRGGEQYSQTWDFSRFTPDAMIINLGTNDFNHDSGPGWEANFTAVYAAFALDVTQRYYNRSLPIFLAQGPMNNGQPLYNALQAAITAINAAGGTAHYLDMRGPPLDGCGGHPGVAGHQQMYAMAMPTVAEVMGWQWNGVPGFISDGGDVLPAANMTVQAGKDLCASTPGCLGITYAAGDPSPAGNQLVYFKNHTDVQDAGGWYTWLNMARA